jgi:D-tyrosyl-tRNA(Tyr) deacylase
MVFMIGLIQLVTHADVKVDGQVTGAIQQGILAFIGIEKSDTLAEGEKLLNRIINYRIFRDDQDKTNLSLKDVQGGLLLVPQFTLVAETNKGTRPGFSRGMAPDAGQRLFEELVQYAKQTYSDVASGIFGAHMQINLCNDGPTTFLLSVSN